MYMGGCTFWWVYFLVGMVLDKCGGGRGSLSGCCSLDGCGSLDCCNI